MTDPLSLEARRQEAPRARPRSWWRYPQLLIFSLCVAVAVAIAVPVTVAVASIALWAQSGAFWPEPIPPHVQYLGGTTNAWAFPLRTPMLALLCRATPWVAAGSTPARQSTRKRLQRGSSSPTATADKPASSSACDD
jgi:hypothetical protein